MDKISKAQKELILTTGAFMSILSDIKRTYATEYLNDDQFRKHFEEISESLQQIASDAFLEENYQLSPSEIKVLGQELVCFTEDFPFWYMRLKVKQPVSPLKMF